MTITGTNLTGATAVKFGTTGRQRHQSTSPTSDHGHVARRSAGTVDVTVTTAGWHLGHLERNDQFTYEAAPTVTGVSPNAGPLAGGTSVTITGIRPGRRDRGQVRQPRPPRVTDDSAGSITATSPAEAPGRSTSR